MKTNSPPKMRGRPRAFCSEKALDSAVRVFWEKGYEGASLPDLTKAMGINRPSLYATFGNKESLFRKAMERYEQAASKVLAQSLGCPCAREGVHNFLKSAAVVFTDPKNPGGCMVVQSGMTCTNASAAMKREVRKRLGGAEALFKGRLSEAQSAGELPTGLSADDLARFFSAVLHGMAFDARKGTTREQLLRVVDTAMQCWPANANR